MSSRLTALGAARILESNVVQLSVHGAVSGSTGPQSNAVESAEALEPYLDQLRQYFARERREFTVPLDLHGTEFQLRCWHALMKIGYGEIRTYAQLARAVGSPNGFRAVGAANGANPVSIIVPCHRVVASDGTLGGYGGGLEVKEKLLRLEGAWPIGTGQLF